MSSCSPIRTRIVFAYALPILLLGCGGAKTESTETSQVQGADTGQNVQGQLPQGHPALSATPESPVSPPPPGSGSGADAITWTVPESWVAETPSSAMRKAQYRIPGAESGADAECVVFYFGPGQGGDAMSNAQRWAGQFSQPDGSPSAAALKTEQIEVQGLAVLTVEVTGSYSGGRTMMGGPSQNLSDYMLLGAIAEGADANWFFKATGPESTLRQAQADFDSMIQSLAPGQ